MGLFRKKGGKPDATKAGSGKTRRKAPDARPAAQRVGAKESPAPSVKRSATVDPFAKYESKVPKALLRPLGIKISKALKEVQPLLDGKDDILFIKKLVTSLITLDFNIPLFPQASLRIMRITANPMVPIEEVSSVIETDQVIAAKVIKVANSPLYKTVSDTTTIPQAVMMLGMRELVNTVMAISMYSKVFRIAFFGEKIDLIREHSMGCAFLAKKMAHLFRVDSELAFLAGLMHDVGKLIVLKVVADIQGTVNKEYMPSSGLLNTTLAKFHPEIGELSAMEWSLPEQICNAIRCHHDLVSAEASAKDLVSTVLLANRACHFLEIGVEREEVDDMMDFRAVLKHFDLTDREEALMAELAEFRKEFDTMSSEFM